jgi:branched-subunit amino acid aminotransferase/4-amino-4-deoxychorismate lyase
VRLTLDEAGVFVCTAASLGAAQSLWTYAISPQQTQSGDMLLQHKTTWRELYDGEAARVAKDDGADEVLFFNVRGEVTEGSRSNVFVRKNGQLVTPPLSCGVLDGVLRREMLESGQCVEGAVMPEDLAGEVWFGNSLRGLIRAQPVTRAAQTG